jgi:hypothetical protein
LGLARVRLSGNITVYFTLLPIFSLEQQLSNGNSQLIPSNLSLFAINSTLNRY